VKYRILFTALCLSSGLALGSTGFCADVQGSIKTAQGALVSGMHILVEPQKKTGATDPYFRLVAFGSPAAPTSMEAVSKSNGTYAIGGLAPGTYVMKLEPGATGFKPGEAIGAVGKDGLTVNWVVSKDAPALAFASKGVITTAQSAGPPDPPPPGGTPSLIPGLTPEQSGLVVGFGAAAIIVGGTIGGICAAGGLGCSASSSM
jgi:hypothetical protein